MHLFCSGAPPRNGCSAPVLVAVVAAVGVAGVFCLGLCGASCCGSSEMSHAIPRHVCQTLKSHRWNCNVLGCCTKFGYPNCVRVLVDETPEANSCVRSSSHDTVHNPRDASNTTPTPQNAKSLLSRLDEAAWASDTAQHHATHHNPKRAQRQASRLARRALPSTASQAAIQAERERTAQQRASVTRQKKQQKAEEKRRLDRLKAKARHRGH